MNPEIRRRRHNPRDTTWNIQSPGTRRHKDFRPFIWMTFDVDVPVNGTIPTVYDTYVLLAHTRYLNFSQSHNSNNLLKDLTQRPPWSERLKRDPLLYVIKADLLANTLHRQQVINFNHAWHTNIIAIIISKLIFLQIAITIESHQQNAY